MQRHGDVDVGKDWRLFLTRADGQYQTPVSTGRASPGTTSDLAVWGRLLGLDAGQCKRIQHLARVALSSALTFLEFTSATGLLALTRAAIKKKKRPRSDR